MVDYDMEKEGRGLVVFRNVLMVVTMIFVLGGALHLNGAESSPQSVAGSSQTLHMSER